MADGRQHAAMLHERPAQGHIIKRPRLTKLLDEAAGARIILLIGPAGYGKTTLAREWTSQRGRQGLWYRARTGASDVAAVARALSAALAPLSETIERSTRELLAALRTPEDEPEAIADLLADELDGWPPGAWLVIDEYELLAPHDAPVTLIERFVRISGAHVLLTSRDRPSWISARQLLYGEAFEIGGTALAMTIDEASKVLESAPHASAAVVALADGWPAVIGLAALVPGELNPTSDVQPALFDYVAQELFDGLDRDVQHHLVLLSIPATLNHALVHAVAGEDAERVLTSATRAGLLSVREGQDFEIHPLCRAFLERKLGGIGVNEGQIDALAVCLTEASKWDDAFEVIRRFGLVDQLPFLIEHGLRQVLAEGRVAALEGWLDWSEKHHVESPELALLRAEIYFRRGAWDLSESLAEMCARTVASTELAVQARLCAGASAHLLDASDRAWDHYGHVLAHDVAPPIKRQALWGRFVASYWTERADSRQALSELEESTDPSPEHLLRLRQAGLSFALREGRLSTAVDEALAAEPLLSHIESPIVRCSFLGNVAYALAIGARYVEAQRFALRQIAEATKFRLNFVLPAAQLNLAIAKVGLGSYTAAETLIERSEREDQSGDTFIDLGRVIVRACIALSREEPRNAVDLLRDISRREARSDIVGEALATRALAEACCGDIEQSVRTNVTAAELAVEIRTVTLMACTRAIVALKVRSPSHKPLQELAAAVIETGCFDTALLTFRAAPELAVASMGNGAMREVVDLVAARSGDPALGAITGVQRTDKRAQALSPREAEVLQLASEGFHNNEIGRRLFISPRTVKTHLQNIYEKLGVGSRTEAAIKAKDAGLLR
jgi:LuxR family transcriptional regulator, maltose regulon positive regulatory protein